MFIAVKKSLTTEEESLVDTNGCEIIGVSIQLARLTQLFIASHYRPPSGHPLTLHMLDDSLSRLFSAASFTRLILRGDFNCSGIDWSCDHQYGHSINACKQALLEVSDKYGLSQHVYSPTRPSSGQLLHLVFS